YQYSTLSKEGKHIRLLDLSPGAFSENLHIELRQVSLEKKSLYFEALSYVWGSPINPSFITIGSERNSVILVTQNLAIALRHLRYTDKIRTLWVDAACINQRDTAERSTQVSIMSDIYQMATHVIVWLGPDENDSCYALQTMASIGSKVEVNWISYAMKPSVDIDGNQSESLDILQSSLNQDTLIRALDHLFHRPWFERLWVRQEIGLANEAVIACGQLVVPWKKFKNAIFAIQMESARLERLLGSRGKYFSQRVKLVYTVCDHKFYLLDHLRPEISQIRCSDQRDRIYGMLSLLHPSHQKMGILPNYSLSVPQVYQDTTLRFIEYWKSLAILFQCELQDPSSKMPTWVPDWSSEPLANPISGVPSNASGYLEAIARYKGKGVLSVVGLYVESIAQVQPLQFGDNIAEFQAMVKKLWRTMCGENEKPRHFRGRSSSWTMCDTICCGLFRHTTSPMRTDYPVFEDCVQLLEFILTVEPEELYAWEYSSSWESYTRQVEEVCQNRSFFIITQGSIGLAPLSARPGDEICVLLGCDSTMLLRPTGGGYHQVVGQSYMTGANTGDALLGPLP
ncbi:uncharacterized protein K452DRAFT_210786, partial [Aplosporella prunicola CBS 121167]